MWSTTSRDVKDGNAGHITRDPEQVKAFRDTWLPFDLAMHAGGVHSLAQGRRAAAASRSRT